MRVIILGGTGLIGKALALRLQASGHEVIVLSRDPASQQHRVSGGIRLEQWDGETAVGWGELITADTALVNLAGAGIADSQWTDERKQEIIESRLKPGAAVVEAVKNAAEKPKVLIQSSAVGYYGPRGNEVITEDSSAGDDFLADVCTQWEASTAEVDELGVRRCIIRTGVILSLDGGAFPRMVTPFRLYAGGPIGSGKQWFPWIHNDDEAKAIEFLMENESTSGVYNLSAPNPQTNVDFSRTLGMVMNRPAIIPVPGFALRTMFGEMATVLLDGQRAVPQRLLDAGFEFDYPDSELALRQILDKPAPPPSATSDHGHNGHDQAEHAEEEVAAH